MVRLLPLARRRLVFDQIFFPQVDPLIGTLAALATYSVGFFARPVGGIVFGHYGDRLGRKAVLVTTLILMGISTALIGLLPSYGSIGIAAPILLLPESTALTGVVLGALISIATIPAFGLLSDHVGRRPVYMFGAAFSAALAFPFFWLFDTETPVLIWLAVILGIAVGIAAMFGPQAAYFTELFGTRVRYSGFAFGRELSSVLAGGLSPVIAVALLAYAGGEPWLVAGYVVLMSVISFVAVYLGPETKDVDLGAVRPEERDVVAQAAT